MFAILALALVAFAGFAAVGSLADSGLRWWSAFGQLRRELRGELICQQPLALMRHAPALSGVGAFERARPMTVSSPRARRAA